MSHICVAVKHQKMTVRKLYTRLPRKTHNVRNASQYQTLEAIPLSHVQENARNMLIDEVSDSVHLIANMTAVDWSDHEAFATVQALAK